MNETPNFPLLTTPQLWIARLLLNPDTSLWLPSADLPRLTLDFTAHLKVPLPQVPTTVSSLAAARQSLQDCIKAQPEAGDILRFEPALQANLDELTDFLRLNRAELRLLAFAILVHSAPWLIETARRIGDVTLAQTIDLLASTLGVPEEEVDCAMTRNCFLETMQLVAINRGAFVPFHLRIGLRSAEHGHLFEHGRQPALEILQRPVMRASRSVLGFDDFAYLQPALTLARDHLCQALLGRKPGVNILIHGPAGFGKTQLARLLAQQTGQDVYEVGNSAPAGVCANPVARIQHYLWTQAALARHPAVVIFDDADEASDEWHFRLGRNISAAPVQQGIFRSLEATPQPAIWTATDTGKLLPGLLRRFSMVIRLAPAPLCRRRQLIDASCGAWLDAPFRQHLASCSDLSPAHLKDAAAVLQPQIGHLPLDRIGCAMRKLLNDLRLLAGQPAIPPLPLVPAHFDPAMSNASLDLALLPTLFAGKTRGTVLLHGPSGSGKRSTIAWLAGQLNRPLTTLQHSALCWHSADRVDSYLSGLFACAEADGAIVALNSAEVVFDARRCDKRSDFLATMLLERLQTFNGLFFVTTSRPETIPASLTASLDARVRFFPLSEHQARLWFARCCDERGLPMPSGNHIATPEYWQGLTPGLFARLMRQQAFIPATTTNQLLLQLIEERQQSFATP